MSSKGRGARVPCLSEERLEIAWLGRVPGCAPRVRGGSGRSSYRGLTVDALASGGDEGRGKLR